MKPNSNQSKKIVKSVNATSQLRIKNAQVAYERIMADIAPFVPKVSSKEITTEGAWQKTPTVSLY